MHVSLSADARADLYGIKAYLEPRSPAALQRILITIFALLDQLSHFPLLGRHGREPGTRELSVPKYPYIIVYTLPDSYNVEIQRILHSSQQFPPERQ